MPHPTPFPIFKLESASPRIGRSSFLSRKGSTCPACPAPWGVRGAQAPMGPELVIAFFGRAGTGSVRRRGFGSCDVREGSSGPHSLLILTSSLEQGLEKYGLDLLVFSF